MLDMKTSYWYILGFLLIVALGIGIWNMFEQDSEIRASVSVAEAMGGGDLEGYKRVTGPREFVFPDDHGPHPGYKTEWWYYTGNLFTADGRKFGYQFTIFRNQLNPPDEAADSLAYGKDWSTNQLYLGHFAISDVKTENHVFEERYSRGAAGLAGAQAEPHRIWLEDWEIKRVNTNGVSDKNFPAQITAEMADGASIDLQIVPNKPLVLQGEQGYDRKGAERGNASYYLSFTRMQTEGTIKIDGNEFNVLGSSWMDHEWSTSALNREQEGWDWFSIQLSNGYDLMYYQLRNKEDSISKFTTGSLITPDGKKLTIGPGDVEINVRERWESPHSKSVYPVSWEMKIPRFDLSLDLKTLFPDQEMDVSVRYYEGTVSVSGTMNGNDIGGNGFIEMTGYEKN